MDTNGFMQPVSFHRTGVQKQWVLSNPIELFCVTGDTRIEINQTPNNKGGTTREDVGLVEI